MQAYVLRTSARSSTGRLSSRAWRKSCSHHAQRSFRTIVHASNTPREPDSNPLLEVVSYGQAVVGLVSERAAAVLSLKNTLAELGKTNAEMVHAAREFQDEVSERAQQHLLDLQEAPPTAFLPLPGASSALASSGNGSSSNGSRGQSGRRRGGRDSDARQKEAAELAELVDNLRADVAAARAALRQLKAQQGEGGKGR